MSVLFAFVNYPVKTGDPVVAVDNPLTIKDLSKLYNVPNTTLTGGDIRIELPVAGSPEVASVQSSELKNILETHGGTVIYILPIGASNVTATQLLSV